MNSSTFAPRSGVNVSATHINHSLSTPTLHTVVGHHHNHHLQHGAGTATGGPSSSSAGAGSTVAGGVPTVDTSHLLAMAFSGGPNNGAMIGDPSLDPSLAGAVGGGGAPSTVLLFDAEVPSYVKQMDREEVYQPLGICVSVGRGGPTGLSKCVSVRITDPRDPFFLYSMTLLEDDYGRFKDRHELMVDFNGFPRDLVGMLSSVGTGGSNNMVTFAADGKESSTLRILERTEFRALEHISLSMAKQGDVGQKKHLAEKFQHFLAAYTRSEHERKGEVLQYERVLADCRAEIGKLTEERNTLLDRTKTDASTAQSTQLAAIGNLKDQHAAEIKQLQSAMEEMRNGLQFKLEQQMTQHTTEMRAKDGEIATLRASVATTESSNSNLATQLRLANEAIANLSTEVDHLRKDNEQLTQFRQSATQKASEQELALVTSTERVRHLTETLKSREDDLKALRETQGSQDGYAKMLAGQLATLQEKVKSTEASLSKAHHILGTQVQALRSAKDKHAALKGQIDANETLLGEKNNLIERLRGDLMNSGDKVEMLQGKVTELKDQLMRSEELSGKLTTQLKQNEDALIHMQRMSSGFGGRTFSSGAGGAAGGIGSVLGSASSPLGSTHGSTLNLNATSASGAGGIPMPMSTASLYRQFAAGMTTNATGIPAGMPPMRPSAAASDACASPVVAADGSKGADGGTPIAAPTATATTTTAPASGLVGGNHLLTGYNSMPSAAGGLVGRVGTFNTMSGSTYPYTSNSPLRTPMAGASMPTASTVSYLPPKPTASAAAAAAFGERPSSYF